MVVLIIGIILAISAFVTLVLALALRSSKPILDAEPTLTEVCEPQPPQGEHVGLADAAAGPFAAPHHT
ncbi:MAG: hypothetical protein ACRC1H_17755 [Caldilineaceae bacterium]